MIFEGTNEILRLFIALTGMKEAGDVLKEVAARRSTSPVSQYGVLVGHAQKWMRGHGDELQAREGPPVARSRGRPGRQVRGRPPQRRARRWSTGTGRRS